MMKTITDLLNQVRQYQGRLGDYYRALNGASVSQRVKMLLDYMTDREFQRRDALTRFEEDLPETLRGIQSRFLPPEDILTVCNEPDLSGNTQLSVDDIIEIAVNMNKCVLDFYEQMSQHGDSHDVRDVFGSLFEMEKRSLRELVRDAQELKDL